MRTWQIDRRKRTRQLIELGGLVVKAGIVDADQSRPRRDLRRAALDGR
ncbi:conjugal transfer protein TraD [Achromobacter aegrifaciens]